MLILVCDGDELKAVKKGFAPLHNCFLPLPIGCEAVNQLLQTRQLAQQPILLIGLAGSLSSQYQVGDIVIYETCSYFHQGKINSKKCDRYFTQLLQAQLNAPLVNGLTSNQLIISPQEKSNLNQESHCQVIDMESYAVMNYFSSVTVVRVISDNYQDCLPDLNSAIVDGQLDKIKMSIAFIQEPFKAIKLIKNALISLRQLELVSKQIGKIIHNSSEFAI